jgi:hypothetical protein
MKSLKEQMADDLDRVFLNTDDFGDVAVYTALPSGQQKTINVIFDDSFKALDVATMEFATSQPQVFAKSSDVTGIKQADTVLVNGVIYTVTDIQPDGTGLTLIILRR